MADSEPTRASEIGTSRFVADMAKFAIVPLLLLGGLLAGLIVFDVLPLTQTPAVRSTSDRLVLGPSGIVVTNKDAVELRSQDGRVRVAIAAESISSPVILIYRESGPSGTPSLPQGHLSTGRFFDLSARLENGGGPVRFRQQISVTVVISPEELASAGGDYLRFYLLHFLEQEHTWEVLPTAADPSTATVVARVGSLSLFALSIGPPSRGAAPSPTAPNPEPSAAFELPDPAATVIVPPRPIPSPLPPADSNETAVRNTHRRTHCDRSSDRNTTPDANADPHTGSNTDSHVGPDANTDANANTDSDAGTDANPNADANTGTDARARPSADTHSGPDAHANSRANAHSRANTHSGPDAHRYSQADPDAYSNSHGNPGASTDSHTNTASLCSWRPGGVPIRPERELRGYGHGSGRSQPGESHGQPGIRP